MRRSKFKVVSIAAITFLLCICALFIGKQTIWNTEAKYNLKIMTFNIRNLHGDDGTNNSWDNRKNIAVNVIDSCSPDLIGMQEAYELQINYFLGNLKNGYKSIGISRNGNNTSEYSNIMYKENKFDVLESGQFWLSDTPDTAGSKSPFDPSMPRICTWAKFQARDDKRAVFYYFNTHLSTVSPAAKQGATIILDRVSKIVTPAEIPVFIGGDFNGDRISTTYNAMKLSDFKDTWIESGKPFKDDGTSHKWTGKTDLGGQHIDWIFHRNALKVNSIEINHYNENGLYPSDHYPVQLEVDIPLSREKSWFDKLLKRY